MQEPLSGEEKQYLEDIGFTDIDLYPASKRPLILHRFQELARKAGIDNPSLYVGKIPLPNAGVISSNKVIVSQELLDILNDKETIAVLAHELGHCMHNTKHTALNHVPVISGIMGGIIGFMISLKLLPVPRNETNNKLSRRDLLREGKRIVMAYIVAKGGYEYQGVKNLAIRIKEDEADDEGIKLNQDKESFISALKKINKRVMEKGYPADGERHRTPDQRDVRLR